MELLDQCARRWPGRRCDGDPAIEPARDGLAEECALSIDPQRMTLRESIARQALADVEAHARLRG